jgi:uncharacterized membrane protein
MSRWRAALMLGVRNSLDNWGGSERLFWLAVFIATGIAAPLLAQLIVIQGVKDQSTFLQPLVAYFFMAFCTLFVPRSQPRGTIQWKLLACNSIFDGSSQALNYIAFLSAGGMAFSVLHASVTLVTAGLSACVLRQHLTKKQWAGCLLVVCGILIGDFHRGDFLSGDYFDGLLYSLAGSFMLAASYPITELIVSAPDRAPDERYVGYGGLFNFTCFFIWQCCWTFPQWDKRVASHVEQAGGSWTVVAVGAAIFGLTVLFHALSFWKSVAQVGCISVAVTKGLQTAGGFFGSHICFCHAQPNQCLSWQKFFSFLVVISGVTIYYAAEPRTGHHTPGRQSFKEMDSELDSRNPRCPELAEPVLQAPVPPARSRCVIS